MIVYIGIGNSDNKLTQARWSRFYASVDAHLHNFTDEVHGSWSSVPMAPYQNACWCIEFKSTPDYDQAGRSARRVEQLKDALRDLARNFGQDSIAWAEVRETTFLSHGDEKGFRP